MDYSNFQSPEKTLELIQKECKRSLDIETARIEIQKEKYKSEIKKIESEMSHIISTSINNGDEGALEDPKVNELMEKKNNLQYKLNQERIQLYRVESAKSDKQSFENKTKMIADAIQKVVHYAQKSCLRNATEFDNEYECDRPSGVALHDALAELNDIRSKLKGTAFENLSPLHLLKNNNGQLPEIQDDSGAGVIDENKLLSNFGIQKITCSNNSHACTITVNNLVVQQMTNPNQTLQQALTPAAPMVPDAEVKPTQTSKQKPALASIDDRKNIKNVPSKTTAKNNKNKTQAQRAAELKAEEEHRKLETEVHELSERVNNEIVTPGENPR
jgi:hypothetical protein